MKLSARNQIRGKIVELHKGQTTAHVQIDIGGGVRITSSITNEAVDDLGLKTGDDVQAVIKASETILFYHPAVWWVSRRVRIEREYCCDDFAVSICGDATIYAEALTPVEAWKAVSALAVAVNDGRLKQRVARLLGSPSEPRRFSLAAMAGLAFLCLIVAGVATAQNNPRFAIRVVDDSVAQNAQQGPPGDDHVPTSVPERSKGIPDALWLKREGAIQGSVVSEAHVSVGPDGKALVQFSLTPEGRDRFAALSRENIGHRLAVVVNGAVVASPTVREPMVEGKGQISGNFTEAETGALAAEMTGTNRPTAP